jgi:hypothetical protein
MATAFNESRANREFVGGEPERLLGGGFGRSRDFEENMPGPNDCNPSGGSSLSFSHPGLGGARRNWLVREDSDPDFSLSFEIPVDRDTACLDLLACDPATLKCLKPKLAEINVGTAMGVSSAAPPLAFAELNSFGHQCHGFLSPFSSLSDNISDDKSWS